MLSKKIYKTSLGEAKGLAKRNQESSQGEDSEEKGLSKVK